MYFAPTAGRYVILRRVTAWGWFGPQDSRYADFGYPGYASANEIWVWENGGGGWRLASQTRYLYDGMRVVQERDGSNVPTVAYTRGLDLSGSLEGAGGIGGLLARSHGYSGGTWPTHSYYHADGAGNVTCLLNASQATVASYRYDPYGRTLGAGGPLASANTYRFSSKEIHANSGLYYFGYRFYDPNTHRWVNRDPAGETFDRNLYRTVFGDPINAVDSNGLWPSGKGKAHQNSVERVLGSLPRADRDLLKAQQEVADSGQNNATDRSFQHAMSWPGVDAEAARRQANTFVRRELLAARCLEKVGEHSEALRRLGNAMHALQDATSPSHTGFQEWGGFSAASRDTWGPAKRHLAQENYDPGADSELDRATLRAYSLFISTERLPTELFE